MSNRASEVFRCDVRFTSWSHHSYSSQQFAGWTEELQTPSIDIKSSAQTGNADNALC